MKPLTLTPIVREGIDQAVEGLIQMFEAQSSIPMNERSRQLLKEDLCAQLCTKVIQGQITELTDIISVRVRKDLISA